MSEEKECTCKTLQWSLIRSIAAGVYVGVYAAYGYKNGFSTADIGQVLGAAAVILGVDITKIAITR